MNSSTLLSSRIAGRFSLCQVNGAEIRLGRSQILRIPVARFSNLSSISSPRQNAAAIAKLPSKISSPRAALLRPFSGSSCVSFRQTLLQFQKDGDSNQNKEEKKDKKDDGADRNGGHDDGSKGNKNSGNGPPSWSTGFYGIVPSIILTLIFMNLTGMGMLNATEMTFEEFRANYLDKGLVDSITVINKKIARATLRGGSTDGSEDVFFTVGTVDSFDKKLDEAQDYLKIPSEERIPVSYKSQRSIFSTVFAFLPTLLLIGGLYYLTRRSSSQAGGGIFSVGKSKAKLFNQDTDVKISFKDVAGCNEAKEEIMEFVKFLKEPAKYERLGAKIPRGAILSGPPGTGKTLLAKATAGEAGVPFLSVSGSEFVEMFVGVGASRVRDLFQQARKLAPSIVFVDEIDAIGKSRGQGGSFGGNDERESTLNQLLVEMDGFSSADHVVVLAGTNMPETLDKALMRPGRFDRHISVDNPDVEGRKEIFKIYLNRIKTKLDIDELAGRLSALTPGFSGADVSNCVNEAALIAARDNCHEVDLSHFERAIERVIAGLEKKSRVLSPDEKKTVAYHEAGHAICGWYLENADPLLKVSIVPRGKGALGYAQYVPSDIQLFSTKELSDRMVMTLGGRVSEEIHFASVTSGASDDFKKVTQMANAMVTKWGMSDRIGWLNFEEQGPFSKPFSDETAKIIDEEVLRIVREAHAKCHDLLRSKLPEIKKIAEELLTKEVLSRDDMIRLLGKRPFPSKNEAFEKYFGDNGKHDGHKSDSPDSPTPAPA